MSERATMISDALVFSEKRPRRPLLSFLTRWYSIIFAACVSLILIISAGVHAPRWTAGWLTLYWAYQCAKPYMRKRQWLARRSDRQWHHFGRSVFIVVCVTIYLAHLYRNTDYLQVRGGSDALWMLFGLAAFVTSQSGVTELVIAALAVASSCLAFTHIFAASQFLALANGYPLVLVITERVLWTALLAFILHVLIRYVGDAYANMRLIHDIEGWAVEMGSVPDENRLMREIVGRVATDFLYPHVSILRWDQDGCLRVVAGASDEGAALVEDGFVLPLGDGICSRVVLTGDSYCSNDVRSDKYFFRHPLLPDTTAELAVPITVKGRVWGVLDIQAKVKGTFLSHDVEVMEILARHLGKALDNIRILESRQRITKIVEDIASQLLLQSELEGTLNQIVQSALHELDSDITILYERNPFTGEIGGPVYAGNLLSPGGIRRGDINPGSLIYRLLFGDQDYYFTEEVGLTDKKDGPFVPSEDHLLSGESSFEYREQVTSRAAVRLRSDTDILGLMFLNFRKKRTFGAEDQSLIRAFAQLAALALQKARFHHQELQTVREDLAARLHDQLQAKVYATHNFIEPILRDLPPTHDRLRARLEVALETLQELEADICYLDDTLKDTPTRDLRAEVNKLIERVQLAYEVGCEVRWLGYDEQMSQAAVVQTGLMLNEAIQNAIKHSHCNHIFLSFQATDGYIRVTVDDDGVGFDPEHVNPRGLKNIRNRANRLGGTATIESHVGGGTRIALKLPAK